MKSNAGQVAFQDRFIRFLRAAGMIRFVNYETGPLTEEEYAIYQEIACHIAGNETMCREGDPDGLISMNDALCSAPLPTVPMLLYVSGEHGGEAAWVNGMQTMADASSDGTLIRLDCGHYVHHFAYERISKDIKAFLEKTDS